MLLSSGLTYGFRRTLPHMAGIAIGFALMVGAVGLGFGAVFIAYPVLQTILKYAGVGLPDLSRRRDSDERAGLGRAGQQARPNDILGRGRVPVGNVKGWVMVIGTITAYAGIASFPWNIAITDRAEPAAGGGVLRRPGRCSVARCGRC